MTTLDLAALERLAQAATPGPWRHYCNKLRPQFGGIINEVQQIKGPPVVHWVGFDSSDMTQKQREFNAAYIAAAHPQAVLALIARVRELEAETADLKTSVVAFCAPWAVTYARSFGRPQGELHPAHYDILKKAGARMDDFRRGDST